MSTYDQVLTDKIIDAVSKDATLIALCKAAYSRAHTIYNGIDLRKPPAQAECPVVSIASINKDPSESEMEKKRVVGAVCEIYDNSVPTSTTTVDGVVIKKYPGISGVESFRKAIENAITGIDFNADATLIGLRVDGIKTDWDTINVYPFFRAYMEIYFKNYLSQGDDTWE